MPLTVAEAAEQWLRAKPAAKLAAAEVAEAEKVLKDWFHKTGKPSYRNLVGFASSAYKGVDTDSVRAEFGDRFDVERIRETLSDLRSAKAKRAA